MANRDEPIREGTNILKWHQEALEYVCNRTPGSVALMSCFVNGEPTAAIVAVEPDGDGFKLSPMFVAVTKGMVLTDHDGVAAATEMREHGGGEGDGGKRADEGTPS